jgi:hypothetical protein
MRLIKQHAMQTCAELDVELHLDTAGKRKLVPLPG